MSRSRSRSGGRRARARPDVGDRVQSEPDPRKGARGGDRRCPCRSHGALRAVHRRLLLVSAARCSAWTRGSAPPRCRPSTRRRRTLARHRKHRCVADKSGQKTGKSSLGAVTALWWMYSRVQGCVTLTAPSSHQVESILWKEIRLIAQGQHPAQRARGSGRSPGINGEPGGRLYMNASGGLWLGDGGASRGQRRTSRSGCRAGAAHSSSTSSMRRPVTPRTSSGRAWQPRRRREHPALGQPDAALGHVLRRVPRQSRGVGDVHASRASTTRNFYGRVSTGSRTRSTRRTRSSTGEAAATRCTTRVLGRFVGG